MKINRDNYEVYFIDYIDGSLDEKLVDDFLEFIQQNPDLKEDLALFKSVSLEPEEIQFNKKEKLYKNKFDLEDHFNLTSVALLEGDLSQDEKDEFENYLNSHPEKKKEFQLFEKTKLHPDITIKYNKKSSLYHRSTGKTIVIWSTRIAAVLVLALTFYVVTNQYSDNSIDETKVVEVTEKENLENKTTQKEIPVKEIKTEVKEPLPENGELNVQNNESKTDIIPVENKETKPVQKNTKSLRENNPGRMNEKEIAIEKRPFEPLQPISRISASIDIVVPEANLRIMQLPISEDPVNKEEERFLADVVKEKTGFDKLSFNKIAKAGLNIVSNISKEKLSYETNETGKVTEISYDSRLLAFSIPTKGESNK